VRIANSTPLAIPRVIGFSVSAGHPGRVRSRAGLSTEDAPIEGKEVDEHVAKKVRPAARSEPGGLLQRVGNHE